MLHVLTLRHLRQRGLRTVSTILAMAVCVFFLCALRMIEQAIHWNVESAGAARLVTRHTASVIFLLPMTYKAQIAALSGVRRVTAMNWFGGVYRDPKLFFPSLAVDAEPFLDMHPEYRLPDAEKAGFLGDRRGCVVGRRTAQRFGWKVGDAFQMESFVALYRTGRPFEFVVRGIYDADLHRDPGVDDTAMLFHWSYLYEATGHRAQVATFMTEIEDPSRAGAIGAQIDALFENAESPTRTETEAAFRAGFASMVGNMALLLNGVGLTAAFMVLLVTANTMSMAVRERRHEIAVLKTLGFQPTSLLGLVLGESALIGLVGGFLGLLMSLALLPGVAALPLLGNLARTFPNLRLTMPVALTGVASALFLAIAAGLVPSLIACRARVVDMLRRA